MGMFKNWLDKAQKEAKEKLEKAADPAEQKKQKKEEAEKTFKRASGAMKLAKKGLEVYNDTAKKVDGIKKDATEKTIDLAEKLKPVADKVDAKTDGLAEKAKGAFGSIKEKISGKGSAQKEQAPKPPKPTTGSGLLDILSPAVPETDATKPKQKKPDVPPAAP